MTFKDTQLQRREIRDDDEDVNDDGEIANPRWSRGMVEGRHLTMN